MSEYIKREDALDKFKRMPPSQTKEFIIETLNAIPAADVEPVVRGEWVKHNLSFGRYYTCSICGIKEANKYARCRCGAHMDRSDPRAATNQVDRCTTCDNNGKPICSSCIMTGHGNDIDFYRAAAEPKGEATT